MRPPTLRQVSGFVLVFSYMLWDHRRVSVGWALLNDKELLSQP